MHNINIVKDLQQAISRFEIESDKCPICSTNKYYLLSNRDRIGLPQSYGICKRCGLIQAVNKYSLANYTIFYNNFYGQIYKGENSNKTEENDNKEKSFSARKETGKTIYDYIVENVKLKSNSTILEIGCGLGGIISYFHDKGYNAKGIDLKEADINFGKRKGLNLERNTIENLKKDEKFDLIILMRSLEHIHQPKLFLELVRRKLNENGILFVSVPSLDSLFQTSDIRKMDIQQQLHFAHIYFFSKKSLNNLMTICGFKNLHINHFINSLWQKNDIKLPLLTGYKKVLFIILFLKYCKYLIKLKNLTKRIFFFIRRKGLVALVREIWKLLGRKNYRQY